MSESFREIVVKEQRTLNTFLILQNIVVGLEFPDREIPYVQLVQENDVSQLFSAPPNGKIRFYPDNDAFTGHITIPDLINYVESPATERLEALMPQLRESRMNILLFFLNYGALSVIKEMAQIPISLEKGSDIYDKTMEMVRSGGRGGEINE